MNQPFVSILDSIIATVVVGVTSAAALLLSSPAPNNDELQLLLVPLVGALIASGGMIMMNPSQETRRITIGRAVFGLFAGTISPQILAIVFTSYAPLLAHPVILLGAGGLLAMIFFALSKPFTAGLYAKSKSTADAILQRGQDALIGTIRANTRDVMESVVEEKVVAKINERADAIEAKQDKP